MGKEPLDPEIAEIARKFLLGITAFEGRETEDCPRCGNHVDSLEEIGRCVYARPCNCRLWQGGVPDVWKDKS
jgi:hypothetical protein